jgi:hypothetical protein
MTTVRQPEAMELASASSRASDLQAKAEATHLRAPRFGGQAAMLSSDLCFRLQSL